jgi:O-antigen ligase
MTHLALLVLFLYPAFTISGQIARMIAVAFCLLCCHPSNVKRLEAPGILLITWFAWSCFCSYLSDNFLLSLFGYHKRWEGLSTWALAISFAWLFWKSSSLNRLFITCSVIILICLSGMVFKPDLYKHYLYGYITISAFITIIACMLMSKHPAFIWISLPFILITQNRSMVLGLACGLFVYIALNYKTFTTRARIILASASVLAVIFITPKVAQLNPNTLGTGARTQIAKQALDFFAMKPLMGYGVDTHSKLFMPPEGEFTESDSYVLEDGRKVRVMHGVDRSHNIILDLALTSGIIGLALWLFMLTRMTYMTFKYPTEVNKACLYGMAAYSGFAMFNPIGIPAHFMACLCVMGIERKQ